MSSAEPLPPPGLVRNESAGFYEFVSRDVSTISCPMEARNVEPLKAVFGGTEIIGFRVWDDARPASDTGVEGAPKPVPAMKAVAEWNGLFDELPPGISDDTEAWMERCDAGDYSTEQLVAHVILDERSRRATLSPPPHGAEPVAWRWQLQLNSHGFSPYWHFSDEKPVFAPSDIPLVQSLAPLYLAPSASREGGLASYVRDLEQLLGRVESQAKAAKAYADEEPEAKNRPVPTVFQIQVSHFTDIAREFRALAKQGGAS